jgi:hypothetical protein
MSFFYYATTFILNEQKLNFVVRWKKRTNQNCLLAKNLNFVWLPSQMEKKNKSNLWTNSQPRTLSLFCAFCFLSEGNMTPDHQNNQLQQKIESLRHNIKCFTWLRFNFVSRQASEPVSNILTFFFFYRTSRFITCEWLTARAGTNFRKHTLLELLPRSTPLTLVSPAYTQNCPKCNWREITWLLWRTLK